MLTPARQVAFDILLRAETEHSYAVELLNAPAAEELKPPDRALAQELVMGCLRWQLQLDWLSAHFSGKDPARWDPQVRAAMRLGIYQLRFLERVPASAAVDQSVRLVKRAKRASAAGLVNAVLRKTTRDPIEQILPAGMPASERRAVLLSHPAWLLERWTRNYGAERAEAIARVNNQPPPAFARVPPGATFEIGRPCRYVRNCRDVSGVARGEWKDLRLQDEASQIIPYLLAPEAGHRILDLCAAPGVKTGAIAELAPGAHIIAADLYPARLRLVTRLAGGVPLLVALDATRPLPFAAAFERILVDAPCTGTGTIRRNPEIKWRLRESDIADLAVRQRLLLANALQHLAPGGRLVYSTCSIEPEENAAVVETSGAIPVPMRDVPADFLTGAGRDLMRGTYLQTLPDQGLDGFFASLLKKGTA